MRVALAALLITAAVAAPASAGLEFTIVTKAEGGREASMGNMVMNAQVEGDRARMEFVESRNPMFTTGSYMLVNAKGEMFIVNTEKKTYSKLDLAAMTEGVGNAMDAMGKAGLKMEFKDPKVEKMLEEPGGDLLGYPTTHYRWHSTFTMVMHIPVLGEKSYPGDTVEDVWTTTALGLPPQTTKALQSFGQGQISGEMKKLVDAEKVTMTGFALKRIIVSKGQGGKGGPTTTTTEVTKLRKADIPASVFAIPAGYTETDLMQPQKGPAMPDLNKE